MSPPNLSEKLLAFVSRDFFRPLTLPSAAIYVDCAERLADVAGEAEACGQLVLKRHRYRTYLIERVTLPLAFESWLIERFGGDLQVAALEIVAEFSERGACTVSARMGGALRVATRGVFIRLFAASD